MYILHIDIDFKYKYILKTIKNYYIYKLIKAEYYFMHMHVNTNTNIIYCLQNN